MKHIPVILFGAGGVGSALLRQIVNGRARTATRNNCHFDVLAVVDSRSWLWDEVELTDEQLLTAVANKQNGQPVNLESEERPSNIDIINEATTAVLGDVVVVDVTAADSMEPVIDHALDLGYGLVLANKKTTGWTLG